MAKTPRTGETADRFVQATLELIEEQGGSQNVNLREVARRVGIAHTNVYHYFDGFPGLMWEAMRQAVVIYGQELEEGLHDEMAPLDYFRCVVTNLIRFPQERTGIYRFISSDQVGDGDFPSDVVEAAAVLKQWLSDVIQACAPGSTPDDAVDACNIILSYLDGESLNLINGRVLPGEDLPGRMLDNSIRLFTLLTGFAGSVTEPQSYPQLDLTPNNEGN